MMFLPITLDYDFSKILATDHSTHTGSCYQHQVRELDDIYGQYGGYPHAFCEANTTIHQLWWDDQQLDFAALEQMLDMEVITVSSIRQDPGNVVPYHRDVFFKIRQQHPDNQRPCVRANIFLEDSRLGHMLQFTLDGKHQTVAEWQANTGFMFDNTVLHLSCNAGLEPKYTLQISGFYQGQEQ
jgi:hypothetical protein